MNYFEKNLKTLAKYYPKFDELIIEAKENMDTSVKVYEEESWDGTNNKVLKVETEDKSCYLMGKRNTIDPADKWIKTLGETQVNAPVFLVGCGNYLYIKKLVEETKKKIAIVIYEPSLAVFLKFLEYVDLEYWMEKHVIVFWPDGLKDMELEKLEKLLPGILNMEKAPFSKLVVLPNYEILFGEQTVRFVGIYRDILKKAIVSNNTRNEFSTVMVKNLLSNARYLCESYKTTQLTDVIPRDIPGILVAAGPSLNKNIEELKKAKGKAFIVAVDTAIKPLIKAGVIPDMFFIVDATKPVELVQCEEARNIPLVTTLNAAYEVLDYHTGMKFFFNEGYFFAETIFDKSGKQMGSVASGGSVATSVFSLMYKLGLKRIILVGQDLAYTDNKSHADGSFEEKASVHDTSGFIMVEGNYEEKVPTRTDFKLFLDWYNYYIKGCAEHTEGFRVINATEGGAKIENTEIMSLKDAIKQECLKEINIQECLAKLEPMLDNDAKEWVINFLKTIPAEFKHLKSEAVKLKKAYKKLDKVCDKNNIDRSEYLSILRKVQRMASGMEKKAVYQLVEITANRAREILAQEQFLEENSLQKEGKEIARKGILYMDIVENLTAAFEKEAEEIFSEKNFPMKQSVHEENK